MGIEPTYPAWKAGVLPLNYTRIYIKQSTYLNNFLYRIVSCECPEPESNQRHEDFQSSALPTELSGLIGQTYAMYVVLHNIGILPNNRISVNTLFHLFLYSFSSKYLCNISARFAQLCSSNAVL